MHPSLFALKRAYLATRTKLDAGLAPYKLTSAQLDLLTYLAKHGDSEQRHLQMGLGVSSATAARLVDGVVAREFITQKPSKDDARVKLLHLTAQGRKLLEQLRQQEEQKFMAQFFAGFSQGEVTLLTEWLQRVADNMGDSSEDVYE
jgi:DNA-binding MarR family transcriptional regulator